VANENDEKKQCHICRAHEKTAQGNLSPFFKEFSRDKETGKGYTVPRYICDTCKGGTDRRIRQTAEQMDGVPWASRLALVEGLR
jgi:hypothetical protein